MKNKQKNNYYINRNIRFFINLYRYLSLLKVQFNTGTSKTWTRTLKNMDPGKHGIYMGLKNMSDFRQYYVLTISMFLPTKYSMPTILIELTNLFRVKSLNVKFSKYQRQLLRGVLLRRCS